MNNEKIKNPLPLYPYQEDAVNWLWDNFITQRKRRLLLADVPGLGKTPPAVVISDKLPIDKIVVITPAIGRKTFEVHYSLFTSLNRRTQIIYTGKEKIHDDTDVVFISIDLATRDTFKAKIKSFLSNNRSFLILDEAHSIKSSTRKVKRARTVLTSFVPVSDYTLFITGTPVMNNIEEIYNMAHCCDPYNFSCKAEFLETYALSRESYWGGGTEYYGYNKENIKQLRQLLKGFMFRRFRKDVANQLPTRRMNKVYLELPKKAVPKVQMTQEEIDRLQAPPHIATARKELGLNKLPQVFEWLDEFFIERPNEQVLIGAYHVAVVEELEKYFRAKEMSVAVMAGKTSTAKKDHYREEFQKGNIQVIVANILSVTTSITLHACNTIVVVEPDWNPATMEQFFSRVHRTGQKKITEIFYTLANRSIDTDIIDSLISKIELLTEVDGR